MGVSATNGDRRVLVVTAGNLKNNHINVREHLDFFPTNSVGPARKTPDSSKRCFEVVLDGLNCTIMTDLPADAKTGKPRGFLRDRTAIASFYKHHRAQAGDTLVANISRLLIV